MAIHFIFAHSILSVCVACVRLILYQCVDKPITINCVNSIKINFISESPRFSVHTISCESVCMRLKRIGECERKIFSLLTNVQQFNEQKWFFFILKANNGNNKTHTHHPINAKTNQFYFIFFFTSLHLWFILQQFILILLLLFLSLLFITKWNQWNIFFFIYLQSEMVTNLSDSI